jgi:transposase-like protein
MIAVTCRRCSSTQLQRNGRTLSGQQKFHCKGCNLYSTLDTKDGERTNQHQLIDKLHQDGLYQCAFVLITSMSRNTVSEIAKKS